MINNNYVVVTIKKDLLLQQFEINMYIPKSTRNISTIMNRQSLMQINPDFLEKVISDKLEFFFENKNMPEFETYHRFSQKMKLSPKEYIEIT